MSNIMLNFLTGLLKNFAFIVSDPQSPLFYLFVIVIFVAVAKFIKVIIRS